MITAPLIVLGQILSFSFAAGLNLYATVALLGLATRFGWIAGLPPGVQGVQNPFVLGTAATLYIIEFFIDKIPYADSVWDIIHTLIRPVAAAFLVGAALAEASLPIQLGGATLAGLVALGAHGLKAGLRLILNREPKKLLNVGISALEDVFAVVVAGAALMYPVAALGLAAAALPVALLVGPRLWRPAGLALRALFARPRGFFGQRGWHDTTTLPVRLRRIVSPAVLGRGNPRVLRAALKGVKGVSAYKQGWIVLSDGAPVFVYQSFLRPRSLRLPELSNIEVRRGVWTDTVEISEETSRCTLFLLKDGPPTDLAIAELRAITTR